MRREAFRTAILAAVIAHEAQGRVIPGALRSVGQVLGHRAMKWLDARRDRRDRLDE